MIDLPTDVEISDFQTPFKVNVNVVVVIDHIRLRSTSVKVSVSCIVSEICRKILIQNREFFSVYVDC